MGKIEISENYIFGIKKKQLFGTEIEKNQKNEKSTKTEFFFLKNRKIGNKIFGIKEKAAFRYGDRKKKKNK